MIPVACVHRKHIAHEILQKCFDVIVLKRSSFNEENSHSRKRRFAHFLAVRFNKRNSFFILLQFFFCRLFGYAVKVDVAVYRAVTRKIRFESRRNTLYKLCRIIAPLTVFRADKLLGNEIKTVRSLKYVTRLIIGGNYAVLVRKTVSVGIKSLGTVFESIVDNGIICQGAHVVVFECIRKQPVLLIHAYIRSHTRKAYRKYG